MHVKSAGLASRFAVWAKPNRIGSPYKMLNLFACQLISFHICLSISASPNTVNPLKITVPLQPNMGEMQAMGSR